MKNTSENEITNPIKAIRAKCLDCCCSNAVEVKLCPASDCPLHAFRMGKNPFHKLNLTDEQRKAISERMRKMRLSAKSGEISAV